MGQANRDELVERIARSLRDDGTVEPLKGLHLHRSSSPKEPLHSVSDPTFCVIAQGSKEVFLSNERYLYDPFHYLLVTAELPLVGHVLEASKERPYLSLRLKLDPTLVGSVMVEAGHPSSQNSEMASLATHADVRAINVSSLDAGLLDVEVRLVRLLDTPTEAPFLAPLITREIVYRLWMGEQGDRLHHIAVLGGYTPLIAFNVPKNSEAGICLPCAGRGSNSSLGTKSIMPVNSCSVNSPNRLSFMNPKSV